MLDILKTILHIDDVLKEIVAQYGAWTYAILFLIVFCETGLVVTPFLPGDSLLFAVGAFVASDILNGWISITILFAAAVLGDAVNYVIGRRLGKAVFKEGNRFLKLEYLHKTEAFYEKYGARAIVLARFVPIVRTIAPFVAGVGKMNYSKFGFYNVIGAAFWVLSMVGAGYFFGNLPIVKENFEIVIIGIILVSIMPGVIEYVKAKFARPATAPSK
ncbi:MAG TPA: DedA family protein [Chthoniobacterales bacterium]